MVGLRNSEHGLKKTSIRTFLLSLLIIISFANAPLALSQSVRRVETGKQPETLSQTVHRLAPLYRQDPKLALKIIGCEGLVYRTLGNNKNYRNGEVWSSDVGFFQINDYYHLATAKKMGLDIYTDKGNIEYGLYLMKKEGTTPWNASKHCWGRS